MKSCVLTALSWAGVDPMPGHYVRAPRGRTAYLILEVRRPKKPEARYAARLTCERRPFDEPGERDVVHGWQWADR